MHEPVAIAEIPDPDIRGLSRINKIADRYLTARAAGAPPRCAQESVVRYIPRSPEEQEAWRAARSKQSKPKSDRRPTHYSRRPKPH